VNLDSIPGDKALLPLLKKAGSSGGKPPWRAERASWGFGVLRDSQGRILTLTGRYPPSGSYGIRVNAVAPGSFWIIFSRHPHSEETSRLYRQIPLKRAGGCESWQGGRLFRQRIRRFHNRRHPGHQRRDLHG
jgi:hypothetical protein